MSNRKTYRKVNRKTHTLGNFYALYGLVVNGSSALFNKFITFDAQIDHFGTLDTEFDELFGDLMDNICCCLTILVWISIYFPLLMSDDTYIPCIW